jgi:hypothetical protein
MPQTDTKRVRFRKDSTSDGDKLDSCLELNCRYIRARFPKAKKNAGARASTSGRAAKHTRPPAYEGDDDDDDEYGGSEAPRAPTPLDRTRVVALGPRTKSKL